MINTNEPVQVVVTFREAPSITQLRMNLKNILSSCSLGTQLEVARIIDNNITVGVLNSITGNHSAQYVLGDLVLEDIRKLDRITANTQLQIAKEIIASNVNERNAVVSRDKILVDGQMADYVGLVIVGAEEDLAEIAGLVDACKAGHLTETDTKACLVFYYGLRVADAEQLLRGE